MPQRHETRIVAPSFPPEFVRLEDGTKTKPPEGWALLPPGDATLTRRVKAAGPSWTVQTKKGRKTFSQGVWAPAETIDKERHRLESERATPAYQRKLEAGRARRQREHEAYIVEFRREVRAFLSFHSRYQDAEVALAEAVTAHATPVGSGTVARTKRISVDKRAEAAVIAWMRHQTTAYDHMSIPRIKGKRREVRAALAKESRRLLESYRRGRDIAEECPLHKALRKT